MPVVATTAKVLDREFLGIRCRLIELAAALDRIARAGGTVIDDPRMSQILAQSSKSSPTVNSIMPNACKWCSQRRLRTWGLG